MKTKTKNRVNGKNDGSGSDPIADAKNLINQATQERVSKCEEEINSILKKHECQFILNPMIHITSIDGNRIVPRITVVPNA